MRYLLDTNVCIYLIQKKPAAVVRRLERERPDDVAISSVTLAELEYGVEKRQHQQQDRTALEEFLLPLGILPFGEAAARVHGRIRAILERKGRPIGAYDLMIGCTALAAGLVLVTNDEREFRRIPDLEIENWAR